MQHGQHDEVVAIEDLQLAARDVPFVKTGFLDLEEPRGGSAEYFVAGILGTGLQAFPVGLVGHLFVKLLGVEKDEVFLEFDDVRRSIDWVVALGVLFGQFVESCDLSLWQ